jgi:hypothetical protein
LTSFELGVTISSIEIELRTERYVRNASKFFLKLDKIDARKLKKDSESVIHSISINLGAFEGEFQQIGEPTAKKFFAFQRVMRKGEPQLTTQALRMSVKVLKKQGKVEERNVVVRGDLASFQCILTLLNCIDLFKVMDKLSLFFLRQKYFDDGIHDILNFYKRFKNDESMLDVGMTS